ncbi:hypothetical protein DQ384_30375 [Sphaerisporangium album]|uniref:Uncharacterized protein n=1 Tax=Sphaerisporangium album TaxID=509200 RepID=A0A367F7C0_9ACTN|nr:hypothetical protein [Sphaerisporangium album]RCG26263.1 hypothetical protein DQ384_30375 [Sphaerisporangium album]
MADEKLPPLLLTYLAVLMRENREVSNPELQETWGLTITGKERLKLNDLKLVDSRRQGRSFVHVLSDHGWKQLEEMLREGIQRPTGYAGALVQVLADGIQNVLHRPKVRLLDVYASSGGLSDPDLLVSGSVDASEPSSAASDVSMNSLEGESIEARIRATYREVAKEPGAWVGLAEIRLHLGDIPRAEVDEVLTTMILSADVDLVPESNSKALTKEDREAAVNIGDQDKHLLWIGA